MATGNWKESAELVGIAAIVASLVFVGWQMKQDRDIALAATYQERTTATVDLMVSLANNPIGLAAEIKLDYGKLPNDPIPPGLVVLPEGAPTISFQEFYSAVYESSAVWFLWDNSHYQYQAGYLPEEHWVRIQTMMRGALRKGTVARYVFENNSNAMRESFRSEVLALIDAIDAEPHVSKKKN